MDSPPEIVHGYRSWRVGRDGRLRSFGPIRPLWPVDDKYTAVCWKNFFPVTAHVAPGPRCGCGIYAWIEPPEARRPPYYGVQPVWGVVKLWGTVRAADWGYRAQFGRIIALESAPELERVAARYGAVLLDRMEDWTNTGD